MTVKSSTTGDGHAPVSGQPREALRAQPADADRTEAARVDEIRRMVREAAWARMFGRNSSPNPFAK